MTLLWLSVWVIYNTPEVTSGPGIDNPTTWGWALAVAIAVDLLNR